MTQCCGVAGGDAFLLAGGQQECHRARGLRGGHRGAVEHRVAGREGVARLTDCAARLPGRRRGDRRAGSRDVRLEAAVLAGPARGEGQHAGVVADVGAVVGLPGRLGDLGADADDVRGDRGVTDGVQRVAGVAGRDHDLDAEVVDDPVVERGAGVVAVVERGQAADRHVDDVDAAVGSKLGHAVGQRDGGAAGPEGAGAGRDEVGAGSSTVHLAAEHVVGGGDSGDVRTMRTGDDADVDEVARAGQAVGRERHVFLEVHDEGHRLDHAGGGVVGAEGADLELLRVGPPDLLVSEVQVLVDVDDDVVSRLVVEDSPAVGDVAVTVDVPADLAACNVGAGLGEAVVLVGAVRGLPRQPGSGERAVGRRDRGDHRAPGAVALGRCGGGERVGDLPVAGRGLLQCRVSQVDAGVEDADRDPAPVPLRVAGPEGDGTRFIGGHVRVVVGGGRTRTGGRGRGLAVHLDVGQRDDLVEVGGNDGVQSYRLAHRTDGDISAEVAELVGGVADVAAQGLDLLARLRRGALLHDEHDGDRLLAVGDGLSEELAVLRAELVALTDHLRRLGFVGCCECGCGEASGQEGACRECRERDARAAPITLSEQGWSPRSPR